MPQTSREKELFERALNLNSPENRSAFLREACGEDQPLRQRVLFLLAASDAPSAFLPGHPAFPIVPEALADVGIGQMIGRYQILEQIGEGGFGIVWLAEQLEPIRRRVALKIVRPGMDSRQIIGRFEAERQVLALMDHPNIAQVFEAGATENGRPYFAMEWVRGVPITRFCAERQLGAEARLKLVIEVCSAVQHAHQKGIIHRDLKPSNILVALQDDRPLPKIIDFGIAKAIEHPLTDKTVFTHFHQFLGTPAYVSPEQASGLDVDTRSDIYSLGVLLYELLTGAPPFDSKDLLSSGLDAMRKTICEREPERPSTRSRRMAPVRLRAAPPANRLARELDLIVLKALEKDRDRRYATANALAEDLRRHLNHEPVTAVAPTLGYQMSKFYRRNRPATVAAAVCAVLLAGAALVSGVMAVKARRAEALAVRESATAYNVAEFLWKEMLKPLTPWSHTNRGVSLREAFDLAASRIDTRLKGQPLAESFVRYSFAKAYLGLGEWTAAETNLLRALESRRDRGGGPWDERAADIWFQLGDLRTYQGRWAEAEQSFREAARIRSRFFGPNHRETVCAESKAELCRAHTLPPEEAEPILVGALERMRRHVAPDHYVALALMNFLGDAWRMQGKFDQACGIFEETRRLAYGGEGPLSSGVLWSLELIAATRAEQGQYAQAERAFLELISVRERVNGTNDFRTAGTRLTYVAEVLVPQARFAEAAPLLLDTLPIVRSGHPILEKAAINQLRLVLHSLQTSGAAEFEEIQHQATPSLSAPFGPDLADPASFGTGRAMSTDPR